MNPLTRLTKTNDCKLISSSFMGLVNEQFLQCNHFVSWFFCNLASKAANNFALFFFFFIVKVLFKIFYSTIVSYEKNILVDSMKTTGLKCVSVSVDSKPLKLMRAIEMVFIFFPKRLKFDWAKGKWHAKWFCFKMKRKMMLQQVKGSMSQEYVIYILNIFIDSLKFISTPQ